MEDFETNLRNEIAAYESRIMARASDIRYLNQEINNLHQMIQMRKNYLQQTQTLIIPGT